MQLASSAFNHGSPIPAAFTCDGANISPPLTWTDLPAAARSLAVLLSDPDAPGGLWVHWLVYDIPAATTGMPADVPQTQYLPGAARQGINDFHHLGYGGPCPPPGKPHRYFFKLYALSKLLELPPGASMSRLEAAMMGNVLATAELLGTYQRTPR